MGYLKVVKIVFLYIGTVIGAGFATGKELVVFFKDTSLFTMIFGGFALGLFCSFYLYLGKTFTKPLSSVAFGKYQKIFDFLVCTTVFFVFVSMFDTSEIIIYEMSNFAYGGYITIISTLIFALVGISFIKKINFLVIPSIVIMVIIIFCKNPVASISPKVSILSPILYAGMNIMLAGYVIKPEGEKLSKGEICLSGVLSGFVLAVVMVMLYEIVKGNNSVMPLYYISEKYGLKYMAGVIIFLAIFTTALSSASILLDYFNILTKNKYYSALFIFLLSIPVKIYVGFENIVNYVYPMVSMLGIMVTIFSLIRLIISKKSKKLH